MVENLFIQGNEACALGAIKGGCRFFAGYPITPSTEVAENLARLLPKYGGSFVQMEDEISSMGAVIGASWGGTKSMTATSGPGISLMQENLGYAFMTETPLVIVDVQRGSPSTGQPTMASQSDMMQARWGSHGDYEPIALSPSSVQEYFDFTIKAFNLAERYRVPVFLLTEESIGHMREKITIPEEVKITARKEPTMDTDTFLPFKNRKNATNPMPAFGDGYKVHVSGLTHDERGYPDTNNPKTHARLVKRLCNKVLKNRDKITHVKGEYLDDADIVIVAYGAPVRSTITAVKEAREEGIKAGYLKIDTPWPFPDEKVKAVCESAKHVIVPEMNLGQMVHEVERVSQGDAEVHLLSKIGGELHKPGEILSVIKSVGGN
ncbi:MULTISPECIES: 2-oxoacid:acceptor oxidoreductase subunit alpha [Methanobrevibacter]|uniref:2-oxoacid:acceptor oxidoreductase subunit alpha n=1 Tax=Methanobrevibacter TaxID=2172 RepID=UPI00033482E4|nr:MULTISPECIES: 2-oxoacid:acceptor oxidoreductase subunit alpha [Methanobrevibacter]AGN16241.1 2-oxoglutarate ferredoxin oxidoreductase subunit alpha KorA [Methanobrevibacter sp. AbM4]MCI6929782.1 2-oxoacid:acceptor oxidoreductase subunit alpha [Methanobrevibacter boviskoreani]MDD6257599.1 2-oxoacid:acceptor oxidoreductase subunit alpha [Methanobrevibacter boviskoreani]MDY5614552.1 2-oxoacid:acceptor oxidoreductase subunit alpha [Methanobrevibacter boviskoreani]